MHGSIDTASPYSVLTIYPARKPIGELVKQLEELLRPSEIEARDDEVLPEPSGL
jgi:hypothetical protein